MSNPERPRTSLKFWQGKGDLEKMSLAADSFWDKVREWLYWLPSQVDADTAPIQLVNLIAWGRDIDRLPNEPEALYRKRVKYALANAKDSGTIAGFSRIWDRLELGYVGQNERVDEVNWDVIELELTESQISENSDLLNTIIRMYGRTCRRYTYTTIAPIPTAVRPFDFDEMKSYYLAKEPDSQALVSNRTFDVDNNTDFMVATA